VYAFREGSSPESIREDFGGVTLAQVYGAIAFYLDHQAQVDAYLAQRQEQWAELERQGAPPSRTCRLGLSVPPASRFLGNEGSFSGGQRSAKGNGAQRRSP